MPNVILCLQIEVNKRREQELVKLRRDLEDQAMQHESNAASLRKKHQDAVNDLADQLDQAQKARQKYVFTSNLTNMICQ